MDFEGIWIKRIKRSSHEESASKLIKKYYKEMYAFVYKQLLDEQMALDLTQEIFIRALQSIGNYDAKKSSFRTWLYRIASNHCVDYFRSRSFRTNQYTLLMNELEIEGSDVVVEQLTKKEDIDLVNRLIDLFDMDTQQILRFRFFEERTFKEISALLNVTESTVKTKFYAAVKKLRKEMEVWMSGQGKVDHSNTSG